MLYVGSAQPFEAVFESGQTGLTGVVQVAVQDNDGNTVIGPTSLNITEEVVNAVPTGVYTWNAPAAPVVLGQYTIAWSPDGSWDPFFVSIDDLVVVTAPAVGVLPPIPPPIGGGLSPGPASAWTTPEAVAVCCGLGEEVDIQTLVPFIDEASELLFMFSGRQFYGLAAKYGVRPPCRYGCGCGQILSRGHIVGDWWGTESACDPSRVLLSGYPVREILQVNIDGDVLAPSEYGLQNWRWLVRKNDGVWPRCQDMSLDDTEDGTWSVSYTYGQNPPFSGQAAAAELACELHKACSGGECALPTGVTRIIRQGIVIEKMAFAAWGLQKNTAREAGTWRTGLPQVDAFLSAFNPRGLQRRPTIWSPSRHLAYSRRALT